MSLFSGKSAPQVLSDELEKKIEEVNLSLAQAKESADKFNQIKERHEKEILTLEDKKKNLQDELVRIDALTSSAKKEKEAYQNNIQEAKNELSDLEDKVKIARDEYEAEMAKSISLVAGLEQREKEVSSKESAIRAYANGLEEKEKKLDAYAERVRRMIDSLKSV